MDKAVFDPTGRHATVLKHDSDLKWERMLPDLGKDSPIFAILRADPETGALTMITEFPKAMHVPKHTHDKGETHLIIRGSHYFEEAETGKRYHLQEGGYLYLPAKFIHEAWVPEGTRVLIILENGWQADWIDGPMSAKDVGQGIPPWG